MVTQPIEAGKPPRRVQMENRVAVTVEATIDEVWESSVT